MEISQPVDERTYCSTESADGTCPIEDARLYRSPGMQAYLSYLQYEGIETDAIRSFNNWVIKLMHRQIAAKSVQFYNLEGNLCEFRLIKARVMKPVNPNDPRAPLYPGEAERRHYTLASQVYVTPVAFLANTDQLVEEYKEQIAGFVMPIPTRSICCRTSELTCAKELRRVGWDPLDLGQYFIIDGNRYMVPFIEKMRFLQISVKGPNKKLVHKVANQIFSTSRGTVLMQAVRHKDTGECLLEVSAFGKQAETGSSNNKYSNNMMNVINIAFLIDYFYFTEEDPPRPLSESMPIENILRDSIRRFVPKSDDPLAWNHIYAEYQSTVQFYYRTSRDKIFQNVLKWLDATKLSDAGRAEAVTQMIDKHIFPTAKSKIAKITMLANLTARLLAYSCDLIPPTNMNKWGNRKLDTLAEEHGKYLRLGLTRTMKKIHNDLYGENKPVDISKRYSLGDIVNHFSSHSSTISAILISPFKPKKTNEEIRFQTTERLDTHNLTQTLSFTNKIHIQVFKKTKSMELRNVQYTQWFYICPEHTPDNEQCGLVKYKTPAARRTIESDSFLQSELILRLGIIVRDYSEAYPYPAFVNGLHVGFCEGKPAQEKLAKMRRRKRYDGGPIGLGDHTCVVFTDLEFLEIYTDEGRLVRPVFYVEEGELLVKKHGRDNMTFEEMLNEGFVGWLDALEEEYSMTSASIEDIDRDNQVLQNLIKNQRKILEKMNRGEATDEDRNWLQVLSADIERYREWPIQYCTLHPLSQFDTSVAMLVFNEHQHPCRVSFGVKMATQAMGLNNMSARHAAGRYLAAPTKALVDTAVTSHFGLDEQPIGGNILMVIATTEYTQEDAMEISETVVNRYAHVREFKKIGKIDSKSGPLIFCLPDLTNKDKKLYEGIGYDGMPAPGRFYEEFECIIGMVKKLENGMLADASIYLNKNERGYVVDVIRVESTNGPYGTPTPELVTVKLEDYRKAKVGDKFASRNGQKYTVGIIKKQGDMPVIAEGQFAGVSPAAIINSHCITSRMTAGLMIEMLLGSSLLVDTVNYDGTSYEHKKDFVDLLKRILRMNGHSSLGTVVMYRGDNGEEIIGEVFSGPLFFMKLCHLAEEKIQGSNVSGKHRITKQAKKGRSNKHGGSVRFGEMEVAMTIAHGAVLFNLQRTSTYSDAIQVAVCRNCFANTWNVTDTECSSCGSTKGFALQTVNHVFKSLSNNLLSAGIKMTLRGSTEDEYIENLEKNIKLKQNTHSIDSIAGREFELDDDELFPVVQALSSSSEEDEDDDDEDHEVSNEEIIQDDEL